MIKNITLSTIVLFVLIVTTANKCKNDAPANRDIIQFNASLKAVESKVVGMNKLMDKLLPIEGQMINYFFDNEGYFYVNSQKLGKIDSLEIDTVRIFERFTLSEKKEFLSTVLFLNENYLSSVLKDRPCKCYLYDYKAVEDKSFNQSRLIYFKESSKSYETLFVGRTILDTKRNLVLLGSQ